MIRSPYHEGGYSFCLSLSSKFHLPNILRKYLSKPVTAFLLNVTFLINASRLFLAIQVVPLFQNEIWYISLECTVFSLEDDMCVIKC